MELASQATKLHSMQDLGDAAFLRKFERARKADIATMSALTSGLDALFATDSTLLKKMRHWCFKQLNKQNSIKKLLIQLAA